MGMLEDIIDILIGIGGTGALAGGENEWITSHGGEVVDDSEAPNGWRWVSEPIPD